MSTEPTPADESPIDAVQKAWRSGMSEAISALAPTLAEVFIKSQGKSAPKGDDAKIDAAGPLFQEAHATSLAVVNDPYAALVNSVIPGGSAGMVGAPGNMLSWAVLKQAARTPLVSAIHHVLLDQISEFCRPSESDYTPGFKVRLRNRRQAGTRASARMCRKFETFISQLGYVSDRRELLTRMTFRNFAVAFMRDSLTYDQACFETTPTVALNAEAQRPGRLRLVDASTIRLSEQAMGAYSLPDDDFTTPRYLQIINGQPVAEFDATQLFFGVRNASTSIYQCGYGISEIEMMMVIITAWLNAFARNNKYFDQGFNGRGFLNIKSDEPVNPQQMNALKADIQAFMTGTQGAHRLGILQMPMEFLQIGNDVQDQQWGAWTDLQAKLACAIYGVEPASLNMVFGNQGQSSAMGTVRSGEREDTTRKRGLIPKVQWFFGALDSTVIQQYDADFELVPTGVETDEAGSLELATKKLAFYSFNEVRALYDLPPREDGDVIGSTVGIQSAQMVAAKEAEPDEPAEVLDVGALFGGAEDADRSTAEVEDAGQAMRDDGVPLQASRRGAVGVTRLVLNF